MASQDKFGDERIRKDAAQLARGGRDGADVDRVTQDGSSTSASDRRRLLRQEWVQEVLPTPPEKAGWHRCWLSTTNSVDPIHKRMQLGYQPVRISDVPGFEQYKVEGGQFEGCVACNEMLLFEIPMERYQDLMMIYHHDMPLEQEQSIYERVNGKNDEDSSGKRLSIVEGDFNNLGRDAVKNPTFA